MSVNILEDSLKTTQEQTSNCYKWKQLIIDKQELIRIYSFKYFTKYFANIYTKLVILYTVIPYE